MTTNLVESATAGELRLPGIDGSTTVFITGGTGAIGYRAAEAFLALGAKVAVMSRTQEAVDEAVGRLSTLGETLGVVGDVAVDADGERAIAEVIDRWATLDILVQCAAVSGNSPLEQMGGERIDQLFAINVKGTLLMAKAAAVPMRLQRRGRIINVSSIMGHRSLPGSVLYGASKAAVGHATRALATELGPSGITVNCISPANTPTMLRQFDEEPGRPPVPPRGDGGTAEKIPLRRRGDFDDYVGLILFFASDLSSYVTGADVLADGGLALLWA